MIIGHDRLKEYFKTLVQKDIFHPCYIFEGQEGVGKKLFAVSLAKGVHCEEGRLFEKCNCKICMQIENRTYPDVVLLEEEELKIDRIREINEQAFMSSFSGKRKFFIFDNFHKIKREAANAMLKTLEEAPYDTTFIMITHNYEMIIPTIRSRSIKISFGRLSEEERKKLGKGNDLEDKTYYSINNIKEMAIILSKIKDRDEFKNLLKQIYMDIAKEVKTGKKEVKYFDFLDNVIEILRSIDYNLNLDIAKGYLLTKLIEVEGDKN